MRSLLALVGPTASGKTAVACELAKKIPLEAVSCDSMQVYRGMPLLTQAPTPKEKKALKAHLVSFLDPAREYNAAFFRRDALVAIEKIHKKGKLPLVVGGTGLYLRALMDGIFEAEDDRQDHALRKRLLKEEEKRGPGYLHAELKKVDPASALRIHANDLRRLVRALEVHRLTGKPLSEQKPNRQGIRGLYHHRLFLLETPREELYRRIEERVDTMLKKGLLKEVRRLSRKKLGRTASVALGFREMKMVLERKAELPEAAALLKKNTRHYAKRQLSWFRHERGLEPVSVEAGESPKKTAAKILALWGRP